MASAEGCMESPQAYGITLCVHVCRLDSMLTFGEIPYARFASNSIHTYGVILIAYEKSRSKERDFLSKPTGLAWHQPKAVWNRRRRMASRFACMFVGLIPCSPSP